MKTSPFQFIECRGTPREMGRQYGEAARDAIQANLHNFLIKPTQDAASGQAVKIRALLRKHTPSTLEELEGVAEGSGVSAEALIIENCTGSPLLQECTSMALLTDANGAVLGKNNDGDLDERRWVLRRTTPAKGLPLLQLTSAGWLSGLDAMNAAGLANGHNSVGSSFSRIPESLEIRLWSYHLMQHCTSVDEFINSLRSIPLNGKGFNVVVADANRNIRVLECAVPNVAERGEGEPFVYATNHYITDGLQERDRRNPDQKRISCCRYDFLKWQGQMSRPETQDDIRTLLASHEPWAPCRHGNAQMSYTLWSMIAVPEQRRVDAAFGPPCQTDYTRYSI